jgi:phosphatidylglycerol:prolipoprotein diacylglycerol transferase
MNSGYLHFPEFDPVIFSIGPVALHWYGLMYLVGFIFAMWLAGRRASRPGSGWTKNEVENLLYAGFLGVFLGGRIGYVLFYNFPVFLSDPLYLFRVWDGGMSFHGGLIGVILVMVIFAYRTKRHFFQVADFIAPLIPFGLGAGRLGNFINGELWGRVDPNVSFTMLFPASRAEDMALLPSHPEWQSIFDTYGVLPRHMSQLYEMVLEGIERDEGIHHRPQAVAINRQYQLLHAILSIAHKVDFSQVASPLNSRRILAGFQYGAQLRVFQRLRLKGFQVGAGSH